MLRACSRLDREASGGLETWRLVRNGRRRGKSVGRESWTLEGALPQRSCYAAMFGSAGLMLRCRRKSFTMKSSLVSCIVPVFNGDRYLGETLDSILAQTYRPLEILVVDDGSTDGTAPVVASYADRIRYVRQDNAGAPTARNLGV